MNFTTEQLEKATDIILEFGPGRSLSRERRLLEIEPNIQADVMNELFGLIDRIQAAARPLGEAVVYEQLGSAAAEQALAEQFPMFKRSTIRRIVNQACYFASK